MLGKEMGRVPRAIKMRLKGLGVVVMKQKTPHTTTTATKRSGSVPRSWPQSERFVSIESLTLMHPMGQAVATGSLFKVGEESIVGEDGGTPEGFCHWAWNDLCEVGATLRFGGESKVYVRAYLASEGFKSR